MTKRSYTRVAWMLVIAVCPLTLLAGCGNTQSASSTEMRSLVRSDIAEVMADIDADQTGVQMSSNPWDYVAVSPAWRRLVDRGPDALDAIAVEIEESEHSGLREYLLAMAGNSILGPNDRISFSTARQWVAQYRSQR